MEKSERTDGAKSWPSPCETCPVIEELRAVLERHREELEELRSRLKQLEAKRG